MRVKSLIFGGVGRRNNKAHSAPPKVNNLIKCMKYQPIYLPEESDENKEPLFNTKKEAWDYIHKKHCHCGIEIHYNQKEYCEACESEWGIEKVNN